MRPRLWRGSELRAGVVLVLAGMSACGGEPTSQGACAIGVVWHGQEYVRDVHKDLARGGALGAARELCQVPGGRRSLDVQRLDGVPPEQALAVKDRRGVYLAMGYPVALSSHPLHDEYFAAGRPARRRRGCSRATTLRGVVVKEVRVEPTFGLAVRGSDEQLVTFHARTRVETQRGGSPFIGLHARVRVQGRTCRYADGRRVLNADVIARD